MRYAWLDKMAEAGTIRKEVLEEIYTDCSDLLEKHADMSPLVQRIVDGMLMGVGFAGTTAAIKAYGPQAAAMATDAAARARIQMCRYSVVSSFAGKYQEKAEARFNEIASYAPSIANNKEVMKKLVDSKLLGLTDRDVQALIKLETASKGGQPKVASEGNLEAERVGAFFADALCDLFKEASARVPHPGALTNTMVGLAERLSVPLAITGLLTGGAVLKKKMDEHTMARNLEASYNRVLQMSPNSVLTENPNKAREAFSTLAHFAPHIAVEPNAAKAFMVKLVSYEQGPHASDLKDLTEVQKNISQSRTGMLDLIQKNLTTSGFGSVVGKAVSEIVSPARAGSVGD